MAPSTRTPSPAREAELILDRLRSLALRLSRGLRVEGAAFSPPLLSALSAVDAAGPIRIGELASAEHVEPATMSRLIDRLEGEGLVRRRPASDDARAVEVVATERTAEALGASRRSGPRSVAAQLGRLPPARRRQLLQALDRLEDLVRNLNDI